MKYVYGKKLKSFRQKLTSFVAAAAILSNSAGVALPLMLTQKAAAAPYDNGFEVDTQDWTAGVNRVPSGTNGITSSSGSFHGTASSTDYTQWDGYESTWPTGGYSTSIDVYLDMNEADGSTVKKFQWNSSINNISGTFLEEAFFEFQTDPTTANQWNVRESIVGPAGFLKQNWTNITTSGWYTLEHTFSEGAGGLLDITLKVIDKSDTVITSHTYGGYSQYVVSGPGANVGGNRYGWFSPQQFSALPIDNAKLTTTPQTPEITSVSAEYIDVPGEYTGVYVGFNEKNITTATDVELRLNRDDGTPYSIHAKQPVLDAVNAGAAEYGTGGTVIITGSRTSGSWDPQVGTWTGSSRLANTDPVEVIITLQDGTKVRRTIALESSIAAQNTEDDVFASVPVDTTRPTISVHSSSPDEGDYLSGVRWTREGQPDQQRNRFIFKVEDESGIKKVAMYIHDKDENKVDEYALTQHNTHGEQWYADVDTTQYPDGFYHISARTMDNAGNVKYFNNRLEGYHVYFDNAVPKITVKDDFTGDKDAKVFSKVSFKLFDAMMADKYVLNGSTTDFSNNKWSDANFGNIKSRLVEGANTFVLYDRAGNSTTYEFTYDSTAPAAPAGLHRVAKDDGEVMACDVVTQRQVLYPTWDANTESDLSHYEYTSYNPGGAIGINEQVLSTNQFVHNWTPPADGTNGYKVRAVDTAGNKSDWSDICYVTYDSTAPVSPIVSLQETDSGDIILNGGITNSYGVVASWTVGADDAGYEYRYFNSITGDAYNAPNYYVTQPAVNSTSGVFNRGEGLHHIQVRTVDAAGNWSDWSTVFDVTYDITPPTVPTITAPGARQWFNGSSTINSWTASTDDNGIAEYEVKYDFVGRPTAYRTETGTSRTQGFTGSYQGPITISVRARDNAGNWSAFSPSVTYNYDSINPVTDIDVSPVVDGVFTVSGDANDNLALNRVYVQLVSRVSNQRCGGTTINLIPEGASASWSKTYDIATLGCPEGNYAAHVAVVDMAGNTSSAGWTANFMVSAPAVLPASITKPSVDNEAFGFPSIVTLEAHDQAAADDNVQWAVRAGTCGMIATAVVAGNVAGYNDSYTWASGTFTADVSGLIAGEYCFVFNPAGSTRLTRTFEIVDPLGASTDEPSIITTDKDKVITGGNVLGINTGGQGGSVLGATTDGLANTGTQNGGIIVLVATGLMAMAFVVLRRKQAN